MRILILSQWFPPEPRPMFLEMAQGLQARGHEVQVVTGFPNWPGGKIYPGYKRRLFQREIMEGVPVLRLPLYPDHSKRKLNRMWNLASLGVLFVLQTPWMVKRPHVIHVIQLPTLGVAAWLAGRFWRAPFTVEVQDIWPESLEATGMLGSAKLLGIVSKLCNWMYKRASAIRVISEGFQENLAAKGVPRDKVHVISNWIDSVYFRRCERDEDLAQRLGLAGRFNVLYAGSIGLPQHLETVLEAAALLGDLPEVQFALAGDGVEAARLRALTEERGLTNVRFLGTFPTDDMPALYALADVNLVHLKDDPLFRITIPHKILSYLAVGRPILAAVSGEPASVVTSAGAGLECPPENAAQLAETVRRFVSMTPAEREAMGEAGRKAAQDRYHKDVLLGRLAEMIEGVTKR